MYVRKVHHEGKNAISYGITIPQQFCKNLGIDFGSYVKVWLDEESQRIYIEGVEV